MKNLGVGKVGPKVSPKKLINGWKEELKKRKEEGILRRPKGKYEFLTKENTQD